MHNINLRDLIAAAGLLISLKLDPNRPLFDPCDLELWQMNLKNYMVHLTCFYKLCVSFHSHLWIKIGVIIRKLSNQSQIIDFSACVTMKFYRWPRKTIGHLFYTISSFVHHFVAVCDFKFELQSRNAHFGSKLIFFFVPCDIDIWWMTLKKKTIEPLFYATSSFVHHFGAVCAFKLKLQFGNANFGSKLVIFCPLWPWNLSDDLEKQ